MKSYTDIEQSKKLAEILSIDSADMCYALPYEEGDKPLLEQGGFGSTPCWSLDALLNYLREIDSFPEIDADEFAVTMKISYFYHDVEDEYRLEHMDSINVKAETFIDACVEMILKLNEQKTL